MAAILEYALMSECFTTSMLYFSQ